MKVLEYLLRRPLVANLTVLLVCLVGVFTALGLNRAGYPNVDFDVMKIMTIYPGASAEDVEINVTKRVEDELKEVLGIERIESSSLENLSLIYVFVDTDAKDPERTKNDILRAVDRVPDLPEEIDGKPRIDELRSSNVAVIELAIQGDAPERELRNIARDLQDEILDVPGVGSVEKIGYRKREVKIELPEANLDQHEISLQEVILAIRDHNVRVSGGNLRSVTDQKQIVTYSEFDQPLDVNRVIIRSNFSGQKIDLGSLADISEGFEEPDVLSRTGSAPSINLLVRSHASADVIDISEKVQDIVSQMRKSLPKGIEISLVSDFSYYTASMLRIVRNNGLLGFLLVIICLSLFLSRYTALWVALGIPISILGALALFPYFGVGINFISLLTLIIVLGLIVDDAIVVGENVVRYREQGLSPKEATLKGVSNIRWPVLTTVVTTILAFSSIGFMSGITGRFIFEIPIVVALALTMSLFESLLILPVHIAHSPIQRMEEKEWFLKIRSLYHRILTQALRHRFLTLASFVLFLGFSFSLYFVGMKFVLFPPDDIDIFHVVVEAPEGNSLEMTSELVEPLERVVAEIPKSLMVNHTTIVGHHDTNVYGGSAGLHTNWALLTVYLRPASERDVRSEKIIEDIRLRVGKFRESFTRLDVTEFYDGPPIGKPVTVTLIGDKDSQRMALVEDVQKFLKSLKGIHGIEVDEKKGKEEIRLRPRYGEMARVGVTARSLGETMRAAYEGVVATEITREGEEIDYRIQLPKAERSSIDVLKKLHVPNLRGQLIPLSKLVTVENTRGWEAIHHYDRRRAATVTAEIDSDLITASEANEMVRQAFEDKVQGLPGFRIVFGGEEKATQESFQDFYFAFLSVLVAMYFVLVMLFNSFGQPLIVLAALPFALGGVFLVFYLHGLPISFLAMIGALGLVGVLVNDALILVSYLNEKRSNGPLSLEETAEASGARLRPVLLTTVTTVAAMVPTIYGFGGSEPFLVPIVLALSGGLLFGTSITLLLVPTLYSIHARFTKST